MKGHPHLSRRSSRLVRLVSSGRCVTGLSNHFLIGFGEKPTAEEVRGPSGEGRLSCLVDMTHPSPCLLSSYVSPCRLVVLPATLFGGLLVVVGSGNGRDVKLVKILRTRNCVTCSSAQRALAKREQKDAQSQRTACNSVECCLSAIRRPLREEGRTRPHHSLGFIQERERRFLQGDS